MKAAATWADLVYRRRIKLGLSVRALARAANCDRKYVDRMETDSRVPSRDIVLRIAAALTIKPDIALLVAGYAPQTLTVLLAALEAAA